MSKQDEIRDRLWNILPCPQNPRDCELDCETCESRIAQLNNILEYLRSKLKEMNGNTL